MKQLFIFIGAILITSTNMLAQTKAGKVDTAQHLTFYACPMHPDIVAHEPGKCPKCGMELTLSAKEQMKASQVKNYTCPIHVTVVKHDPGKCPKCGRKMNLSPKEQMKAEVVKLYTCPMHPEVSLDKEGVCPKCGKALTEKKNE
jgi:transcription initiation factor IIE alpha subunit